MSRQTPRADEFKQKLRDSLRRVTLDSRALKIARHQNVYTCGDQDEMVYFIESGQIKLRMLSSEGKECLLAIHSAGDISVDHPDVVANYRAAQAIAVREQRGSADTEELRKAVVHYRALFDELLEVREPRQEIIAEKRVAAR